MDKKKVHTIHGKTVWKQVRNAKIKDKDLKENATVSDLLRLSTVFFNQNLHRKSDEIKCTPRKTNMTLENPHFQ